MSYSPDNHPVSIIGQILEKMLKISCKTDINGQIEYVELLNNEFMECPTFIAIIQSLKELKAIKLKNNKES
jgi:arginine repressor